MIRRILYYTFGFLSTSALLAIPRGESPIQFYLLLLPLIFVDLTFLPFAKTKSSRLKNKYVIWTIITVISSLFGILYFLGDDLEPFRVMDISYIPKIIIYFVLFLFFMYKKVGDRAEILMKGIMLGMIFNVVICIVESLIFYATGVAIIKEFLTFSSGDSIARTIVRGESIRSTGFTVDPATVALYAIILTSYGWYTKKYIYVILSFICSFATISATMIVGSLMVTIYHMRGSKKNFIRIALVSVISIFLFMTIDNPALKLLKQNMVERMDDKVETGDARRADYWFMFPEAVAYSPHALIFGTGYMTASYAYIKIDPTIPKDFPYDPEQQFFANFFDWGLPGLIVWLSLYFLLYKKIKLIYYTRKADKLDPVYLSFVESVLVVCLFYHYTLFVVIMLILMCAILRVEQFERKCKVLNT